MSKNKRCLSESVSQSVSQWQGHLLSCQVTAKKLLKIPLQNLTLECNANIENVSTFQVKVRRLQSTVGICLCQVNIFVVSLLAWKLGASNVSWDRLASPWHAICPVSSVFKWFLFNCIGCRDCPWHAFCPVPVFLNDFHWLQGLPCWLLRWQPQTCSRLRLPNRGFPWKVQQPQFT